MHTLPTEVLKVTVEAPGETVARDLADPLTHPAWATEFFYGAAEPRGGGEVEVTVPLLGGSARMRVDADVPRGVVDLYLAPAGAPFGPPLPVRVVPNGDGCDVLWVLARFPGVGDDDWSAGLASMRRELDALARRHGTARVPA